MENFILGLDDKLGREVTVKISHTTKNLFRIEINIKDNATEVKHVFYEKYQILNLFRNYIGDALLEEEIK